MTVPQLKPSPVHESSLRQALQRVEDRLRKQDEKRKKDLHHERTLKLARSFAAQGVRQRQRDWERQSQKNRESEKRQTKNKVIAIEKAPTAYRSAPQGNGPQPRTRPAPQEIVPPAPSSNARRKPIRLMPIAAWVILSAGIIGAVLSWTTISNVRADALQLNAAEFQALPMGLLLGFAYLATGVMGFAFFWVFSLIGNQLKEIRRLLLLHPFGN